MGNIVTGVVQEIQTRSVSGGKTAYNVVVGGESYGAGLYAPKCKVGDYVKFGVDESRGYKNVERNSLKVSANKPPAEAVAEAAATAPAKSTTGGSVDHKQEVISRQSATNSAIAYLQLLQAAGALPAPPKTKGSAQEFMDTLLSKYVQEFYESNTGVVFKDISPSAAKDEAASEEEAEVEEAPDDTEWK